MSIQQYKRFLQNKGATDGGIVTNLSLLSTFYQELIYFEIADGNPPSLVLKHTNDLDPKDIQRIHVTVDEMGEFFRSIPDPMYRTLSLVYVKHGARRGAGLNLDGGAVDCNGNL